MNSDISQQILVGSLNPRGDRSEIAGVFLSAEKIVSIVSLLKEKQLKI